MCGVLGLLFGAFVLGPRSPFTAGCKKLTFTAVESTHALKAKLAAREDEVDSLKQQRDMLKAVNEQVRKELSSAKQSAKEIEAKNGTSEAMESLKLKLELLRAQLEDTARRLSDEIPA